MGALEGSIVGAATRAASGAAINGGIAFVTSGGDLEKTKQAATKAFFYILCSNAHSAAFCVRT